MYNPTKDFNFTDAYKIEVPCNTCEHCRDVKRLEWQFRIQEELLHCSRKGYNCYFGTLTYNDVRLPRYEIIDDYGDIVDVVPCFSRDDITSFVTGLRHSLYNKYKAKDLSFIFCCEYGSHTQRPHYHFLLCVDSKVKKNDVHRLVRDLWSENGFLFPRYVDGGIDSSGYVHKPFQISNLLSASSYVSKYVCKDLSFIDSFPQLESHRQELKKRYKDDPTEENEQSFKTCNRVFPFIRVSKGFGSCINDKVSSVDDVLNGVINIATGKLIKLPAYNLRKLLYNVHYIKHGDETLVRYTPNELGVEYLNKVTDRKIAEVCNSLNDFVYNDLKSNLFKEFCEFKNLDYKIEVSKVKILSDRQVNDFRDVAVYSVCFRNRVFPDFVVQKTNSNIYVSDLFESYDIDYLRARALVFRNGHIQDLRLVNDNITKSWLKECSRHLFNNLVCFTGYDDFLDLYHDYRNYLQGNKSYFKAVEDEQRKKVKQMFTHLIY